MICTIQNLILSISTLEFFFHIKNSRKIFINKKACRNLQAFLIVLFLKAAQILNISPQDCLVFEDSPKGIEAAQKANMNGFVLTTMHPIEDFEMYKNVKGFEKDYISIKI